MGRLTTHVLDTARGRPAAGLRIDLFTLDDGRHLVKSVSTNADGRADAPLLEGDALHAGEYELLFHAGDYFKTGAAPPFLNHVPIRFGIADATQHYHVPLLLSPYSYSTYRGS
jgi:5-hydroxyisourate hydrolase